MLSNLLSSANFLVNGMRQLTFFIDKGVYSLVSGAYSVFYYLSNASILNDRVVTNFTLRMYTLLSIIMVFVLAFNLLNYIIDPDKITDKKIGASAFIKDVIIALVIISMTPMLFTKLYSFQSKVITSGVISNLILGGNTIDKAPGYDDYIAKYPDKKISLTEYYVQNGANTMIASVYVAFLYPNDDFTALDCYNDEKDDGTYAAYCDAYTRVKSGSSINAFSDFISKDDKYNFTPLLSTVAGVVLLFFMLSFCLDLGKRVGKLAILQLIAPVPCTLELLPNKKGLRKGWIDMLIKVYLEVFMYLGVMYIIVFLISLIPDTISALFETAFGDGIGFVQILTCAFLIFGLLMFGKEAPQMLFDLLGIKSTGVIAAAAKRAVKMAGSVTAGVGVASTSVARNGYGAFKNFKDGNIKGGLGNVAGMFTSGATGLARGMYANRAGGFKGIVGRTSGAISSNLAHQGEFTRGVVTGAKNVASSVAKGATRGAGIGGHAGPIGTVLGGAAGAVVGAAGGVTRTPREAVGKWARGSNYGAMNAELQSYSQYKGVFDSTKIKPASDERYMSFQKDLDKVFADNGIDPNVFNARKKAYISSHAGSTLADYLASADFAADFGAAGAYASADISRLSGAMDSREAAMKVAKKDDLLIAVAQAKALIESNADVAAIARDNGIDIKSISISASSSDADLISAYDTLKKLNSKVGDKMTQIRTDFAAQEMRDKQKKSGSGGGSK